MWLPLVGSNAVKRSQEYIRNTQPVSGNMGFKAGSGKGATIEAEMAAYDRKTFGAETYGKRPKGVSTAEWSKRQSHKGKFKQLAGTRNEQVAELDREIEAYKLENMTPVQRLELARETPADCRDSTTRRGRPL